MADIDWVWMKHPGGSEAAPFAPDAAEFWQARGWEITEKPAEPDPTAEPAVRAAETTADDEPVADTKPKTAGRQRRAETEES